eukprot:9134370-Pyramimonas_sp.AAC.1
MDNGAWGRFEATTPAGARTSLFICLDKNAQMVRREIQTKKLLEIIEREGLPGRWRANRAQGVIYQGSSPVVRVIITDEASVATSLQWNYRM